nr:IS66 family insertion sequence element accessory protein TnpB [Myxococcus xanthus]
MGVPAPTFAQQTGRGSAPAAGGGRDGARGDGGDRVKVLTWSRGGFVLLYKRLETGRFRLPPVDAGAQVVHLDATQLAMLLDGIDVAQVRRQPAWTPPGRTGT